MGALDWNKIVHQHQGWRLISCIWLHAGLIHLVVNMLSLLFIGIRLEQQFGFGKLMTVLNHYYDFFSWMISLKKTSLHSSMQSCRLRHSFQLYVPIFVYTVVALNHSILTLLFLAWKFALVPYTYYLVSVAASCLHSSYGTATFLLVHLELYLACLDPCFLSCSWTGLFIPTRSAQEIDKHVRS